MGFKKISALLDMIKFEHTVFALPFAYLGMVLAADGWPGWRTALLVTAAMVGARTFAMAVNRLCDRNIDAANPRTAGRALPSGVVSVTEALLLTAAALGLFFGAVALLPPLCHRLWPVVLIPMAVYSLAKRFTWLCHLLLGICLGLAPLGAWVATAGTLPPTGIWLMGLAVTAWTAGFDIIYSCQDYTYDRIAGLHSIPARFGPARALRISRGLHAATVALLGLAGLELGLKTIYYLGLTGIAGFLYYEQRMVRPDDLSRVNAAFFTANGFVSILAFICTTLAL